MKTCMAAEVNKQTGSWWTWTDAGEGRLCLVLGYNRKTGWLSCQGQSFMVTPQERCYQFDSVEERREFEATFQAVLAQRRQGV